MGRVQSSIENDTRILTSQAHERINLNIKDGRSHSNVEELSRGPCLENSKHSERQEAIEMVPVRMLRTDFGNEWRKALQLAQQNDPDIKPILEWIKTGAPKPKWRDVAGMSATTGSYWGQWDSLAIHDGLLCRKLENARGDHCHLQMVVPKAKVPDVLQLCHDGCSGGRMGIKRALSKIREQFFWIHCRDDVRNWCRKPADLITSIPKDSPRSIADCAIGSRFRLDEVCRQVERSGQRVSEKMRARYNRKLRDLRFDKGSLVGLHDPVHGRGGFLRLQAERGGTYPRYEQDQRRNMPDPGGGQRGSPGVVYVNRLA